MEKHLKAYYFIRNVALSAMPVPPYIPGSNAYIHINFLMKDKDQQLKVLSSGKTFINFKKL